jgi:predicted membrane channel-forming protein YqfA (hemolysin III family)
MEILRSPVFIICCFLFGAHQALQKLLQISVPFVDLYLDNLLAMPIILTLLLAERRILFKRGRNYRLPLLDVVVATIYIIFIAELIFPLLSDKFVADWWDVLFYTLGSVLFLLTINRLPFDRAGSPQKKEVNRKKS